MDWKYLFFSLLFGGLAGTVVSIAYSHWRSKQEYRSLILAFCSEFCLMFERSVIYYEQQVNNNVSYSALFSFTDPSAFSKFASVTTKPEVAAAIIELKSMYFQIQRHVEEASRFALDASRASDENIRKEMLGKALHAQGTALAFFHYFYNDIESKINLLIHTGQQLSYTPHVMWMLSSKFSEAKSKYYELKRKEVKS